MLVQKVGADLCLAIIDLGRHMPISTLDWLVKVCSE